MNVVQQISPGKQQLIELPIPFKLIRENYVPRYRLLHLEVDKYILPLFFHFLAGLK